MLRKFVLSAAAAALTIAPVAAQAAPARIASPVSEEENMRGGYILPAIVVIALLIGLYLAADSENDPPLSP